MLEVAPGVELRVARQAVLRRVETLGADAYKPLRRGRHQRRLGGHRSRATIRSRPALTWPRPPIRPERNATQALAPPGVHRGGRDRRPGGDAHLRQQPGLGLDLQGGVSVVLEAHLEARAATPWGQSVEIIRDQVDALGVAEPEITARATPSSCSCRG